MILANGADRGQAQLPGTATAQGVGEAGPGAAAVALANPIGSGSPVTVPVKLDTTQAQEELPKATAELSQAAPAVTVPLAVGGGGEQITSYADLWSEFQAQQGKAFGGLLQGPDAGDRADNMVYRGTPGEFVLQRPSVRSLSRRYGIGVLHYINQFGELPKPRFAFGGMLGNIPAASAPAAGGGGLPVIINLNDRSYPLTADGGVHSSLASDLRIEVLKRGRR